jgi:hypothetical protein
MCQDERNQIEASSGATVLCRIASKQFESSHKMKHMVLPFNISIILVLSFYAIPAFTILSLINGLFSLQYMGPP